MRRLKRHAFSIGMGLLAVSIVVLIFVWAKVIDDVRYERYQETQNIEYHQGTIVSTPIAIDI